MIFMIALAQAQLTASFTTQNSDPSFTFTNTSTGFYDTQWWDFGDGSWGYNVNESHTYTTNGTYYVCLTVVDSTSGVASTDCDTIVVSNAAAPSCNVNPSIVDSSGYMYGWDSNWSATSYEWYVWDPNGNLVFNSSNSILYYYPNPNTTYTVCLYGYDNGSFCDSTCTTFTSGSGSTGCQSSFYWYQDSTQNNTLTLVNTANGNNLSYSWDFGDGNTATGAYPSHTYAQNGTYTVCLTIDDGAGCTDTFCDTLVYVTRASGFTVNVVAPTALSIEDAEEVNMGIFPNPADNVLNIQLDGTAASYQAMIIDMKGAVVRNINLNATGAQINISDLDGGLYLIRLTDNNGNEITTEKLMVR